MVQRPLATMCASVSPVPANVPSDVSGISVQGEGCVDAWLRRVGGASIAVSRRECCQWQRKRCTIGQPRQSGLQALLRPVRDQSQACRTSDQTSLGTAFSVRRIFPSCRCRPRCSYLQGVVQKVPSADLVLRCAGHGGCD